MLFRKNILYRWAKIKKFFAWKTADYYVLSFPKSGRTWIRVFLAKYFELAHAVSFDDEFYNILRPHRSVPKIVFSHRGYWGQVVGKMKVRKKWGRGYTFRKEDALRSAQELQKKDVIFIFRDPRDVVVSHYFELTKRAKITELQGVSISYFIRHQHFGIQNIIDYNNFWYEKRNSFKSFTLFSYEKLLQDTKGQFTRLLKSFGLQQIDKKNLQESIDFSSFNNMRQLERSGAVKGARVKPANINDTDSYKTRKGKVGGYKDYLSSQDIQYVGKEIEKLHRDLRQLIAD